MEVGVLRDRKNCRRWRKYFIKHWFGKSGGRLTLARFRVFLFHQSVLRFLLVVPIMIHDVFSCLGLVCCWVSKSCSLNSVCSCLKWAFKNWRCSFLEFSLVPVQLSGIQSTIHVVNASHDWSGIMEYVLTILFVNSPDGWSAFCGRATSIILSLTLRNRHVTPELNH